MGREDLHSMALPQDTRVLTQVVSATRDEMRKELIDNLFNSNALFARLYKKNRVTVSGAEEIRVPFLYDKTPFTWYTGMGALPIEQKEIATVLPFDWKQAAATITLPGIDAFKNRSPYQLFDIVAAQLTGANMTLADRLGEEI